MKNKTIFKEIPVNPYVARIWLIITNNPYFECAKMNQRHKDIGLDWSSDSAAQTERSFYKDNYLVVIFDGRQKWDINTICHEVVHIKNAIYNHAEMAHDDENDEPEAYLSGWIAEQIHNAWLEYKKL